MDTYTGKVERIVDGDTLDLLLDLGFGVAYLCRVRLRGVYAPEAKTANGKTCKTDLAATIQGMEVIAELHGHDLYMRWLADLTNKKNGQSVNDLANQIVAMNGGASGRGLNTATT